MGEVDIFINVFTFVDFNDEIAQAIFEFALETEVITVQEIKEAYWNIGDFRWQNAFLKSQCYNCGYHWYYPTLTAGAVLCHAGDNALEHVNVGFNSRMSFFLQCSHCLECFRFCHNLILPGIGYCIFNQIRDMLFNIIVDIFAGYIVGVICCNVIGEAMAVIC